MKRLVLAALAWVGTLPASGVYDLHFNHGDSAQYLVNRERVYNVDLNINGTHLWDMTVPFGSEKLETMVIAEPQTGHFGSEFPQAQWVAINYDHEEGEINEAYMGRRENRILLYGYGDDVTRQPLLIKVSDPEGDLFCLFPMVMGRAWGREWTSTVGDTTFLTNTFREVVDTGQVITEAGTFPCVVLYTRIRSTVYVLGFKVKTIVYHQYDWFADSLNTLALIRSREGEPQKNFVVAERTQRIVNFWPSDAPAVTEARTKDGDVFDLEAVTHPAGIRVSYTLRQAGHVHLACYDACGSRVWERSLRQGSGRHEFVLDGLGAGVYFIRLEGTDGRETARCVHVK